MIRIGRYLSVVGIIGYLLVISFTLPQLREALYARPNVSLSLNLIVGVAVLASFVAWALALYDWATNYRGIWRRRWGVALVLGAFIGAWVYWLRPGLGQAPADRAVTR
jgi:hypothetical protein